MTSVKCIAKKMNENTYNSLISSGSFGFRPVCPYSDSLASSVSAQDNNENTQFYSLDPMCKQ